MPGSHLLLSSSAKAHSQGALCSPVFNHNKTFSNMEPHGQARGTSVISAESAEAIPSFAKASEDYPFRIHPRLKPWSPAKEDKRRSTLERDGNNILWRKWEGNSFSLFHEGLFSWVD